MYPHDTLPNDVIPLYFELRIVNLAIRKWWRRIIVVAIKAESSLFISAVEFLFLLLCWALYECKQGGKGANNPEPNRWKRRKHFNLMRKYDLKENNTQYSYISYFCRLICK